MCVLQKTFIYKRPSSVHSITLVDNAWNSKLDFFIFFCEGWEWPAFEALFTNLNGELLNILWNKKVKLSRW